MMSRSFALPTYEMWVSAAQAASKDDSLDALTTTTHDGLVIEPLYTPDTSGGWLAGGAASARVAALAARSARSASGGVNSGTVTASGGWQIRSTINLPSDLLDPLSDDDAAESAATAAGEELAGGVDALTLGNGWSEQPGQSRAVLLRAVLETATAADKAPAIYLQSGARLAAAKEFAEQLQGAGITQGSLGLDPIGAAFETKPGRDAGLNDRLRAELEEAELEETASYVAAHARAQPPGLRALALDGTAYNEAGAGDIEELGALLANATLWLRLLTSAGLDAASAAAQIEFTITASADVFVVVAKCRALRRCWAQILDACGVGEAIATMSLHAIASTAMMSRDDPWVNVLRGTTAALAASLGGADAVTLLPLDAAGGAAQAQSTQAQSTQAQLGRRIARNTQLILLQESQTNAVIDPAGGSWFVEDLTEQIAQRAWHRFTSIEAAGGIVAETTSNGDLRAAIAETAQRRAAAIATQQQVLVGVNEFAYLEQLELADTGLTETLGETSSHGRWAEPFEQLRAKAIAAPIAMFVAALGKPSDSSARANFAKSLFEAGGIATIIPEANFDGPADVVAADTAAAFAKSQAQLACICSSDEIYATQAAKVVADLKSAGAVRVYIAGDAASGTASDAGGGAELIAPGCDALQVLTEAHQAVEESQA